MFPGILFLLPLFVIFVNIERSFGITLYGTYLGLIITYLTFSLPFSIWMLVGYFNSIPRELEEAAMTEGATPIGALFRILIPVSVPGIAAVAIYAFITAWGEVLFASVLTTDETRTLAIGLRNYSSQTNVYWNQLMAAAIVVSRAGGDRVPRRAEVDRARADRGRRQVIATTGAAGVRPLITRRRSATSRPARARRTPTGRGSRSTSPATSTPRSSPRGPDRAPVLRPQRGRLRVDGGARVVVPRALRRRAGGRTASACG